MELPKFQFVSFVSLWEVEKISRESLGSGNFLGLEECYEATPQM